MRRKRKTKFLNLLFSILIIAGMLSQNVSYVFSDEPENTSVISNSIKETDKTNIIDSDDKEIRGGANNPTGSNEENQNLSQEQKEKSVDNYNQKGESEKSETDEKATSEEKKDVEKSSLPQNRSSVRVSTFKLTTKDNVEPDGNKYRLNTPYKLTVSWDATAYSDKLVEGDYFDISLPKELKYLASQNVIIQDSFTTAEFINNGVSGLEYTSSAKVRITFNKNVLKTANIKGRFDINTYLNDKVIKEGDFSTIRIGQVGLPIMVSKLEDKNSNQNQESKTDNTNSSKLQISVLDSKSYQPVSNVKFTITNLKTSSKAELSTGAYGYMTDDNLPAGKYSVELKEVPVTHTMSSYKYDIEIPSANGSGSKLVYLDRKVLSVDLQALLTTEEAKEGAFYKLQRATDRVSLPEDVPYAEKAFREYKGENIIWDNLSEYDNFGNKYIYSVKELSKEEIDKAKAESDLLAAELMGVPLDTDVNELLKNAILTRGGPEIANLETFITGVDIVDVTEVDGVNPVNEFQTYSINLSFAEDPNGNQFADAGEMTYTLPEGLVTKNLTGAPFSITVEDGQGTTVVDGNSFKIEDGVLKVNFNTNHPDFSRLRAAANTKFSVGFETKFRKSTEEIIFGNGITKKFEFSNNADLNLEKQAAYDKTLNIVKYKLIVKSTGFNNNVELVDTIVGTALEFNKDVKVKSKIGDNPETIVDSSIDGSLDLNSTTNGFKLIRNQLKDGEVLTVEYTAKVLDSLVEIGTADETKNIAKVKSDEQPNGKQVEKDLTGKIYRLSGTKKAKRGADGKIEINRLTENGQLTNKYEVEWIVTLNEDKRVDLSGVDMKEVLFPSAISYYSGTGFAMKITKPDGSVSNSTVSWTDSRVTNKINNTNYPGKFNGFTYTLPADTGKSVVEITYKSVFDATGQAENFQIGNTVKIKGQNIQEYPTINGVGTFKPEMKKIVLNSNYKETEWQISFNVPKEGVSNLLFVDDLPRLAKPGTLNGLLHDEPILGSLKVDGLYSEESYTLDYRESAATYKGPIIRFYKSKTQNNSTTGLNPSTNSQDRKIVITFKSKVNQEWLELASKNGYDDNHTSTVHRNSASVEIGNSKVFSFADAKPKKQSFKKKFVKTTKATIGGIAYPVFHYSLFMENPIADTASIQDSFDTNIFKYYNEQGIKMFGGTIDNQDNPGGTVSATNTQTGIDINITDFAKNSGKKYQAYRVDYAIIVKDKAALDLLNQKLDDNPDGYKIENIATWGELKDDSESSTIGYLPGVDKNMVDPPVQGNNNFATFTITVNPYELDLDPDNDRIAVVDQLSQNLRFEPGSVTFTPTDADIKHSYDNNVLKFSNIPDGKKVTLTYKAKVLGQGKVNFSNTVTYGKYKKIVNESVTITSSGSGTASIPSINLVKADFEDNDKKLPGAIFQLFLNENGVKTPVTGNNGPVTFTTGPDGTVKIIGNQAAMGWTLIEGKEYLLEEIQAPTGFELGSSVNFVLKDNPIGNLEYGVTGGSVTATNKRIKTRVSVEKVWKTTKTNSIKVVLLNGNKEVASVDLSDANQWKHTFENIDKLDENGNLIQYTIKEIDHQNRFIVDVVQSGNLNDGTQKFTITNSTKKKKVKATKEWVNGPANKPKIYFRLYQNITGQEPTPVPNKDIIALENGTLEAEWIDLPETDDNGNVYVYTVKEVNSDDENTAVPSQPEGYTKTENGLKVVNTYEIPKGDITAKKIWENGKDPRPTTYFKLYRQLGTNAPIEVPNSMKPLSPGTTSVTWTGLELKNEQGEDYKYLVKEVDANGADAAPQNYTKVENGLSVTNTYQPPIGNVEATKKWVNGKAVKPDVWFKLYRKTDNTQKEVVGDIKKLPSPVNGEAKVSWDNLPKTDVNGNDYIYSVEEVDANGNPFEPEYYKKSGEGTLVITNTFESPKIGIPVTKTWVGPSVDAVTIKLLENGQDKGKSIQLTKDNNWTGGFTNLPKFDDNGEVIVYTIKEVPVANYQTTITQVEPNDITLGFKVKNLNIEKIKIPVKKVWRGVPVSEVTIQLVSDQVGPTGVVPVRELKLNPQNNWSGEFTDLPKYDPVDGKLIKYQVKEISIASYSTAIEQNNPNDITAGFTVTNTYIPPYNPPPGETPTPKYVEFGVKKDWVGKEAKSIRVHLLADGKVIQTVDISADNNWKYTFKDLPMYDKENKDKLINYTIKEDKLEGYITTISGDSKSGYTITNTELSKRNIKVEKVWDGKKLKSARVNLYADNVKIKTVDLTEATGWKYVFEGLPVKDENGKLIIYTITEDSISGYERTITGDMDKGFVITNKHIPGKPNKPRLPQTGDIPTSVYVSVSVALLALGILFITRSKFN